ncbi:MAG TPA: autotransporter-associated beta strand repeat-containing protein [Candidatus Sulfotelmatobacter sp.]|nr:autotransporter-associated beta strand repeat-containing protein [Candidatus Sulfotelmatobacter sp.]
MKTSKTLTTAKLGRFSRIKVLTLAAALVVPAATGLAQNYWNGITNGSADYNIATNWVGNVVPTGGSANPANDNGSNSVILIQAGDPTWSVNSIRAGWENNASGSYLQTGGTVTTALKYRLGAGNTGTANNSPNSGSFGFYTLSNGVINCGSDFNIGELGTAVLNVNGGAINMVNGNFGDNNYNGAGNSGTNAVTDVVNQTAGIISLTGSGQLFVGNGGAAIYNLSGGTNTVNNYIAFGRSGGNGTVNMTGGLLVQNGGGNLLVGTGFQNPAGGTPWGVLNQSGGTINCLGQFLCPETSPATGTYNLSGTGALIVNNWLVFGRSGGNGVLNLTNGSITKTSSGNNFLIGSGATGTVNQYGGNITNTVSPTDIGDGTGTGIWNLYGGNAHLGVVDIIDAAGGHGTLNLNGGVMSLQELTTAYTSAVSVLNLNGGTLQASGNNSTFFHDIQLVNMGSGGVTFDSQSYNITVSQALPLGGDAGGNLTKIGTGTLTLTGANTYAGNTVVSNGTLFVDTGSGASGNYTVADNAGLGVLVQSAGAQLVAQQNLTLGTSTGASINFNMGTFGNPNLSQAPLYVSSGTFTVNGTITVNVADALPQLGEFPLVQYQPGGLAGSGSFVVGSLPVGVMANIVTNSGNNSIDLNITAVNLPRWEGLAGGNWDIGVTTNWINIGTGLPTTYGDGNAVVFNDNAIGTTNVNLVTTVSPSSVTANNSSLNYTLAGSGKISGSTGFTKEGTGTFTIVNTGGNNYTGPTVIGGGTLSVTNLANGGLPSAIGASSSNPTNLVLSTGTLSYTGPAVSVNRGYYLQTTNDTIDAENNLTLSGPVISDSTADFTKTGPAQLIYTTVGVNALCGSSSLGYSIIQGTTVFNGSSGGQTNNIQGHFGVGGLGGTNAAVILTNTTLNVTVGGINLGQSGGAVGTLSMNSGAVLNTIAGNFALGDGGGIVSTGVVNQAGGTVNVTGPQMFVGQNIAGVGSYNLSGGTLNINNWLAIGRQGGTGIFTLSGSGVLNKTGSGNLDIGTSAGVGGFAGTGTLIQTGGAITNATQTWLGEGASGEPAAGIWTMSGGTAQLGEVHVGVGGTGTNTLSVSGTATITESYLLLANYDANTIANVNMGDPLNSGGTVIVNADMNIGGQGTANLNFLANGGGKLTVSGTLYLSRFSQVANGTVNLNAGGTLVSGNINNGWAFNQGTNSPTFNPNAFNFNGGTWMPYGTYSYMFPNINAVVQAGGAIINDNGNSVEVGTALVNGGGGGGLTKLGAGKLVLDGVNTYTGTTLVSSGVLAVAPGGVIAGPLNVASGATLAGDNGSIGAPFSINNTLTLSNGCTTFMQVTPTSNDQVIGLTSVNYGGALVVTNTGGALTSGQQYTLFNASLAGSGNFSSVTILPSGSYTGTFNPATGILTIASVAPGTVSTPTFSGGSMTVTGSGWNPGTGYTWLSTTNLVTPIALWTTNTTGTFSATGTFTNSFAVTNPPAQFFRLRSP